METQIVVPCMYRVTLTCFIDEKRVLSTLSTSQLTRDNVAKACESQARTNALEALMPVMYEELNSSMGFRWGQLKARRRDAGIYDVTVDVICSPEWGEDADEFYQYVQNSFDRSLGEFVDDGLLSYERAA